MVLPVLALCAACSAAPSAGTTTIGSTSAPTVGAAAAATPGTAPPGRALAEVVEFGLTVSTPTNAASGASQSIEIATPRSTYGGVVLGGGAGIVVAKLPGPQDPALDRLLHRARAAGVTVEIVPATRSLAELDALGNHDAWTRLPANLTTHLTATQVDVARNRVVLGFDVPLDESLRAVVAATFGDSVVVAKAEMARLT
jgi:hypothetical protein